MYHLLTESLREQHKQLVDIIIKACTVEKIFLLGSTLMQRRTESIFMPNAPSCIHIRHYYVLVLINNEQGHNQVQDTIENCCAKFIPVTAIVLNKDWFEEWLMEGHPFAQAVFSKAVVLYGEEEAIPILTTTKDEETVKKEQQAVYTQGLNKAEEFLAGADLYRIRMQNKMCSFMLHQAAEQSLHTILKLHTGLHVVTHSLDKLVRYCSMVSNKLPEIFITTNEKDKRLFTLLQKAYIDTRYKDEYSINTTDLLALTEKVKRLHGILKETNVVSTSG